MKKITKYKIVQKDKREIPLDEDEVEGVMTLLSKGGFIKTRAAIFDSATVSSLIADEKRTEECLIKRVDNDGNIYYETEMLEDIFKDKNIIDDNILPETNYKQLK
ncbi:TPA: hypothetical protein DIU22_02095 [Candidatus Woesebacteria bacterium]|nr:hypothetical protein [Candidatus Woesebacteria bacterium]